MNNMPVAYRHWRDNYREPYSAESLAQAAWEAATIWQLSNQVGDPSVAGRCNYICKLPAGHPGLHVGTESSPPANRYAYCVSDIDTAPPATPLIAALEALREEICKLAIENEARHYEEPAYVSEEQWGFVKRLDGILARYKEKL